MLSNVNSTRHHESLSPLHKDVGCDTRLVALRCAKYNGGVWDYAMADDH